MSKQLRRTLALAPIVLVAVVPVALGKRITVGPVKGATYAGVVHDTTITLAVAGNGKTARASLPSVPGFCQGGAGPELQSSKAVTISSTGRFTSKIAYSSPQTHKQFATATVSGYFFGSVFQGTVKSHFLAAASKSCDGQESFEAVKRA
jgi:hypothetical protein